MLEHRTRGEELREKQEMGSLGKSNKGGGCGALKPSPEIEQIAPLCAA